MYILKPENLKDCHTVIEAINKVNPKKVLLLFQHGLGDAIDFYANVLPILKSTYQNIDFIFSTWHGQTELFGNPNIQPENYDLIVKFVFPTSEWDKTMDETKAERCLRTEIGISGLKQCEKYIMPKYFHSPLIGTHFFSTSGKGMSCSEIFANKLWNFIKENGFIPFDTHITRSDATLKEYSYGWQEHTMKGVDCNIKNLFGIIQSLGGFIGVPSGNLWTALSCLDPKRILYIETEFPVEKITRLPVWSIKDPLRYNNIDINGLINWINYIKNNQEKTIN